MNDAHITESHLVLDVAISFARAVIGAYGLSTALHLLLWWLVGERWAWLGFFQTFAHLLWLGALLLLPVSLLVAGRQPSWAWLSVVALLPAVIALLVMYAPRFLPKSTPQAPPDSIILRVHTHNIAPRTGHYDGIDALIAQSNADFITLQEVSDETVAHLRARWRDNYPYMALSGGTTSPNAGQGFLSRYPIREAVYWQFDWLPNPLGYQRLLIDVAGYSIVVYNVHPTHPGMADGWYDVRYRQREIDELVNRVLQETHPVIVMGDFNLHDTSRDYAHLSAHLTDVYREVGWGMGWTFPTTSDTPTLPPMLNALLRPILRLDYIFVSDSFLPLSAYVSDHAGDSDHHAITAQLAFRPPS